MEMREWLSIAFIVVIALILLDGFRRKWVARRNSLRFKIDKKNIPSENDSYDYDFNHELPNGGARSAEFSEESHDEFDRDSISAIEDDDDVYDDSIESAPEDEDAPVLTDAVGLTEEDDYEDFEDEFIDEDEDESEFEEERYSTDSAPASDGRIEPSFGSEPALEELIEEVMVAEDQTELFIDHSETEDDKDEPELPAVEEVIVFNVMAKSGEVFTGKELLPILMEQGMRLGDMSIFHRHGDMSGNGPVMFSMANMVKPGTFNISEMEEFTTPGISFFLQLPNPIGNMPCFEIMLAAVNAVKEGLDGELKDENRNIITHQVLEHSREIIRDFELKQLTGK